MGEKMSRDYLIAADLEGIHGIVGEPYKSIMPDIEDYDRAVKNAVKEINTAVKALFDAGAERVAVWDNHWKGQNIDFSMIDSRAIRVENPPMKRYQRLSFADKFSFKGIVLLGYHSKEGSFNGVLAHTYSALNIQYYKVGGKTMGEAEIDAYIAGEYDIPVIFAASDDVCIGQIKETIPGIHTVVTKIGKGRNAAIFLEEEKVLQDIYSGVKEAVSCPNKPIRLSFPCDIEVNYTRAESAASVLSKVKGYGQDARFGETTHIVRSQLRDITDLEAFI